MPKVREPAWAKSKTDLFVTIITKSRRIGASIFLCQHNRVDMPAIIGLALMGHAPIAEELLRTACGTPAPPRRVERLSSSCCVVKDCQSRIGLVDRRADAMLGQSLLQLQSDADGQVRSIPIAATAERSASVVHVVPVRGAANDIFAASSCVLVITAVAHPEIASTQVVQGLFDLTPAEARIARGIAAGKTVDDLAHEAGLALGTVRQQLKAVFSKTGVSRQVELASILVGSALRLPGNIQAGRYCVNHRRAASKSEEGG